MTDILHKMLHISWFCSAHEVEIYDCYDVQWVGLAKLLTNPQKRLITPDEKSVSFISFARFEDRRRSQKIRGITAIVMDYNNGTKYEEVRKLAAGYEFVAYSTHSHTEEKPKFRLIMPPSREITLGEWPRIQASVNAMLGNKADPAAKDATHIFSLPACPEKKRDSAFAFYGRGKFLDPDLLLSNGGFTDFVFPVFSGEDAIPVPREKPGAWEKRSVARQLDRKPADAQFQWEL